MHSLCIRINLNCPNGNWDNLVATWYISGNRAKRGENWEGLVGTSSPGCLWPTPEVRSFYGDRKRRDQKSVKVWRSFCGGGADTFSCRNAGPLGQRAACWLRRSLGLGVREIWAQTLALAFSSFVFLSKLPKFPWSFSCLCCGYFIIMLLLLLIYFRSPKKMKET